MSHHDLHVLRRAVALYTAAVRVALLPLLSLALLACTTPPAEPAGVVVPPDASAEVAGEHLDDIVALVDDLAAAGLLSFPPGRLSRSGLEAAGVLPPVVMAARPSGGIVVSARLADAARLQLALTAVLPDAGLRRRRLLGQVDAVVDGADQVMALVRAGNGLVLLVIKPADALAEAALIEGLATGAVVAPRRDPRGFTWRVVPSGPWRDVIDGDVEGTVERRDRSLVARTRVALSSSAAGRALGASLSAPTVPASCVVEDDALAVLHLPAVTGLVGMVDDDTLDALPGPLDAFDGRLTVALMPPLSGTPSRPDDLATLAGLAVIGRPRAGASPALQASIDDAVGGAAVERRVVGLREVQTVGPVTEPWRRLSVVVADDVFAAGLGAPVVVDRVAAGASCPPGRRLLTLHGPALVGLVERAAPELRLIRRLATWTRAADPLALLAGLDTLIVDAGSGGGGDGALDVEVALTLTRRQKRAVAGVGGG